MRSKLVLASSILTLFFATAATAASIAEIVDAGDAIATAQDTTGQGTVDSITGSIGGSADADLYRIYINDPANFTANTVGSAFDTQLWLFDASGLGIAANDDCPGGCGTQSSLDPGNALYSGLTAGEYYLGVSAWDNDPVDAGNAEIFPNGSPFNTIEGPTSANPLAGWNGGGGTGDYVINLRGVGNNPIPEPSAALLYLAGFGVVGGRLRRRGRNG